MFSNIEDKATARGLERKLTEIDAVIVDWCATALGDEHRAELRFHTHGDDLTG